MQTFVPAIRPGLSEAIASDPLARSGSRRASGWGFLEFFVIAQIMLPALLFLPGTQPLRVPIRVAPFALSLMALLLRWVGPSRAITPRTVTPHPVAPLLVIILVYLAGMVGLPTTNTLLAGLAQVTLYAAVMAPVFWAPAMVPDAAKVRRVLAILLVCCGINALVAILQVYRPETFLPRDFSVLLQDGPGIATFIGPQGQEIVRPPGLSDNPGAVCAPASVAALLGLIFATRSIGWPKRAASLALAFAGMAAIFLSHVRTSILIVGGMCAVYVVMLWFSRQRGAAAAFLGLTASLLAAALFFATTLGGESVTDRFATLFEDDPATVYYKSARGFQLQYDTQAYLTEFPMGAGLGRWGMMRAYFGDETNARSPLLWAELQWPAWALDGGFVLLISYMAALLWNTWRELRACRLLRDAPAGADAAMIFACNIGVLALVFGFTPFTTQIGLQYWLLAGLLHGLSQLKGRALA
jgi:hypothetical protein